MVRLSLNPSNLILGFFPVSSCSIHFGELAPALIDKGTPPPNLGLISIILIILKNYYLNPMKFAILTDIHLGPEEYYKGVLRKINKDAIIMVISHNIEETNELYDAGATYVIMPHFLGGSHASRMIDEYKLDLNKFLEEKQKHIKYLKNKKILGHEHPKIEKN